MWSGRHGASATRPFPSSAGHRELLPAFQTGTGGCYGLKLHAYLSFANKNMRSSCGLWVGELWFGKMHNTSRV